MSIFALSTRMVPREAIFSNERIISEFRSGYLLRDICTLPLCIAVRTDTYHILYKSMSAL
jgi:hypothetical protein